jgi:hypothetical protein
MLRILLPFLFLFPFAAWSQGSLIFFAENGERFTLMVNGQTINNQPDARVRFDGVNTEGVKVNIKFDRVGVQSEIGNNRVTESFTCSGVDNKFALGWLAEPAKSHIIPLLDGKLVLSADYTIEYFTETVDNYTKKHCRFVFLNYVHTYPNTTTIVKKNTVFVIKYR